MFTVLLIDDEKSVIETLKNSVPWSGLGVESVLTAGDGLQALGILSNFHVDLLISDIRMPHMDGLSLLKTIRSDYPDIHYILLTAYKEFEYAMTAMKLGVDNYLTKPIQMQELTDTIENTLDNIYIRRKNISSLFRENILRRWITGSISSDELGERSALTDLNIYQSCYCTILIQKKVSSVSITAFSQECTALLPDSLETACAWDNTGHYVILVGGGSISLEALASCLYEASVRLRIDNKLDIAIGMTVHDHMDVQRSYLSALELLQAPSAQTLYQIRICPRPSMAPVADLPDIGSMQLSPVVRRTINYIEEHYAEGISMKEISLSFNINAAYLGYLFKKETGIFFNHYLTELRLEHAMELLCHTGKRISDIAAEIGFATTSHFITTFKKKTGLSPLKYRESNGNL